MQGEPNPPSPEDQKPTAAPRGASDRQRADRPASAAGSDGSGSAAETVSIDLRAAGGSGSAQRGSTPQAATQPSADPLRGNKSAWQTLGTIASDAAGEGARLGRYTLRERLGAGSFGEVWRAKDEELPREVAVKIVRSGIDAPELLSRFEQEREVLSQLRHRSVATVYGGGVTPDGRPYFAMELVRGASITAFCDRERLGIRERLAVFIDVCEGVQHAHQNNIAHRDLKPDNVLVELDAQGRARPVVIDFGMAKLLNGVVGGRGHQTGMFQMLGTTEYMSPEQADPYAVGVDNRTDVYSLGVMLYEVLTGVRPFSFKDLQARQEWGEIRRILRDVEPPAPSTRISTIANSDAEQASAIAQARGADLAALEGLLQRELQYIPLMAMRKERRDRYATPSELGDDIRRYLDGLPLRAAPDSLAYRARKYVRRNRVQVVAAGVVMVGLGVGSTGAVVGEINSARAETVRAQASLVIAEREAVEQRVKMLKDQRESLKSILDPYLAASVDVARGSGRQREILPAQVRAAEAWKRFCDRPAPAADDTLGRAELVSDLGLLGRAAVETARVAASGRSNLTGAGDPAMRATWKGVADDAIARIAVIDPGAAELAELRLARDRMTVDELRKGEKRAEALALAERALAEAEAGILRTTDPEIGARVARDGGLLRTSIADLLWMDAIDRVKKGARREEVNANMTRAIGLYDSETVRRRELLAMLGPDRRSVAKADLATAMEKAAYARRDPEFAMIRTGAEAAELAAQAAVLEAAYRENFLAAAPGTIPVAERQVYAVALGRLVDFQLAAAEKSGKVTDDVSASVRATLSLVFATHLEAFLADTSNLQTYTELLKLTERNLGPARALDAAWRRTELVRIEQTVLTPIAAVGSGRTATPEVAAASRALEMAVCSRLAVVLFADRPEDARALAMRGLREAQRVGREASDAKWLESVSADRARDLFVEAELAAAVAVWSGCDGAPAADRKLSVELRALPRIKQLLVPDARTQDRTRAGSDRKAVLNAIPKGADPDAS